METFFYQKLSSRFGSGRIGSDGGSVDKNSGRIESSGEWGRIGAQISDRELGAPVVLGEAGSQNSLKYFEINFFLIEFYYSSIRLIR